MKDIKSQNEKLQEQEKILRMKYDQVGLNVSGFWTSVIIFYINISCVLFLYMLVCIVWMFQLYSDVEGLRHCANEKRKTGEKLWSMLNDLTDKVNVCNVQSTTFETLWVIYYLLLIMMAIF